MFTLTITSSQHIPFTIKGSAVDLTTVVIIMQSGLQMCQNITVEVSSSHGTAKVKCLRDAACLTQAFLECIMFTTPKGAL